jgi:hypothetical protein
LKSDASLESESSASSRTIEDRLKTQKEDNSKQVKQIQKILSMEENRQLDEECLQRFIKVNVRLLTDDQVRERIFCSPRRVRRHARLFEAHDSSDVITSHEQQTKQSRTRHECVHSHPMADTFSLFETRFFHRLSNKIIASIISITDSRDKSNGERERERGKEKHARAEDRTRLGAMSVNESAGDGVFFQTRAILATHTAARHERERAARE